MTKYVTYMSITLHSGGATPSEIARVMEELGWKPIFGACDFAYAWDKDLSKEGNFEKYCENINAVHDKLGHLNLSYNLQTFKKGKEGFTIITCV